MLQPPKNTCIKGSEISSSYLYLEQEIRLKRGTMDTGVCEPFQNAFFLFFEFWTSKKSQNHGVENTDFKA